MHLQNMYTPLGQMFPLQFMTGHGYKVAVVGLCHLPVDPMLKEQEIAIVSLVLL
jgi:hypothetical protein